ncbi:MAG: ATP-binding cassette domain-containing protein [Fibrobacter sp.]|nr:ATP-binding cassette domain-containing protein [Fibrobacter sp.]
MRFLPLALLASGADAAVLWGIRQFMGILSGQENFPLWTWVVLMLALTALRLCFLSAKIRVSEGWVFTAGSRVMAWFLHRLRLLHPRNFHTRSGERQVESAYESVLVLQNNGSVLFQAVQAVLQLAVFLPVLLYISWQLTVFLFVIVVPVVAVLQRKLHKLGPVEESLLRDRSEFRGDLLLARRLFRQWSSKDERSQMSQELLTQVRHLRDHGASNSVKKNSLSLVTESVSVVAMVLVLAFCSILISKGWMDGSGLVLFCSAVLLSYKPVKECARVMPQFRSAVSAIHVLEDFEKLETRVSGESSASKSDPATNPCFELVSKGSFRYDGSDHPVFENLNIAWNREKPVLVRGRNGVGKSTLLRLLAGLELWDGSEGAVFRDVFFVAQDLELPPRRMLKKFLATAAGSAENKPVQSFAQFANVLPLLDKSGLSGGERSRVALLWSLASSSKIILLDEPFASIALADREPLLAAFLDGAEQLGKWVVVVSHDVLSPGLTARFNEVHFE